jgi:homoserine kinase
MQTIKTFTAAVAFAAAASTASAGGLMDELVEAPVQEQAMLHGAVEFGTHLDYTSRACFVGCLGCWRPRWRHLIRFPSQ